MTTHSYHDRPVDTLKADVWSLIMAQVKLLQSEMFEVGFLTMKGSSNGDVGFIAEGGQRQTGQAMDFEEDVCLITLNLRAKTYDIDENAEDAPSFSDAGDYMMSNIVAYMTAVTPADQPFNHVEVILSAADGLTITVDGQAEPWAHPGVVDTPEALRDFFEAEIEALSERIGARYIAYAQGQLDRWNATWPSANFTLGLINGSTLLEADLPDGRRQLLKHWRSAQINEVFPGLSEQFDALEDLEGDLESRVMPAINGTLLKPTAVPAEAEPDESPAP